MKSRRGRRTSQFFITVGPVEYYAGIHSDFLDNFECVKEYLVSIEKYHSSSNKN
jgi:hypothetical protein